MDPFIPIAGMATGVIFVVTVARLIRHWVDRHYERVSSAGGSVEPTVARLEERVAMLEEVAGRMQDLEERVDFTERVLTRERDPGRLPPSD
jgi:hypothetical protein